MWVWFWFSGPSTLDRVCFLFFPEEPETEEIFLCSAHKLISVGAIKQAKSKEIQGQVAVSSNLWHFCFLGSWGGFE